VEIEYSQPPKAPISITTDSGDVSLSLPAGASFSVSAVSKSGDLENDFGGSSDDHAGSHSLNATYGSGGPQIRITSHYGDIHIHKN
jgi:Putative adhesin